MTAAVWTDSLGLSDAFMHCQVLHLDDLSGAWRSTSLERLVLLEHSWLIVYLASTSLLLGLSLNSASLDQVLPWLLKLLVVIMFGGAFMVRCGCLLAYQLLSLRR